MVRRRVWVKRSTGSATLVSCLEDAVVDELRDHVILKFANSVGRMFDSPDIMITITPREGSDLQAYPERFLSPEEVLSSVLDVYYPGGQAIEEALVIDAPMIRTTKPSPRHSVCRHIHSGPDKYSSSLSQVPTLPSGASISEVGSNSSSNSILTTEDVPSLPSRVTSGTRHMTDSPAMLSQARSPAGMLISILNHSLADIITGVHRIRHTYL